MAARTHLPLLIAASLLLAAAPPAHARIAGCEAQGQPARAYLDCLNRAQERSARELARALAGAQASIEASGDLHPSQRRRWSGLLTEAQGRFIGWRDFECQGIAPFEGRAAAREDEGHGSGARRPASGLGGRLGGSGVIEQRLVCLISHDRARAEDLALRYPPPPGWTPPPEEAETPAALPASTARSSLGTGSVRIIDLSP